MNILLDLLFLVAGFFALIKGADWFVEGSAALAKRFKVPGVVIGLTIVAMGTSAPELAVSTSAAIAGSNEIAISNVIGSNLFNLLVVLGVCAIMAPVAVEKSIMRRDFPFSIVITLIVAMFAGVGLLAGKAVVTDSTDTVGTLNWWKGLTLLALFALYLFMTVRAALKNRTEGEEIEEMPLGRCLLLILIGIAAIIIGGQVVVGSAKNIALFFGMSETLVGLTIVAIGTSLPELVTSIVASSKGQNGMAVGNVVGSNIFNLLLILGVSSAIHPIGVAMESVIDLMLLIVASGVVFVFAKTGKKITRFEGWIMVLTYAAYTAYAIIR